jgi:hypothetical protein
MFQLKWNKNAVPGKPLKRNYQEQMKKKNTKKIKDMKSIDRKGN